MKLNENDLHKLRRFWAKGKALAEDTTSEMPEFVGFMIVFNQLTEIVANLGAGWVRELINMIEKELNL